jgi:hypothetical protein
MNARSTFWVGVALSALLALAAPAWATDYFVNDGDPTNDVYCTAVGNDANAGTSPGAPKATIQNLLSTYNFSPGDRIFIDTGIYFFQPAEHLTADGSGTAASPIQYIGSPIPRGTVFRPQSGFSMNVLFQIRGNTATVSYIQIKNIFFECNTPGTSAMGLRLVNAANITVENCIVAYGKTVTIGGTTW